MNKSLGHGHDSSQVLMILILPGIAQQAQKSFLGFIAFNNHTGRFGMAGFLLPCATFPGGEGQKSHTRKLPPQQGIFMKSNPMKAAELLGLAAEHHLSTHSIKNPDLDDLLNALEERHQCINHHWQEIMQRLPEEKPDRMMDQILQMDQEISRYQRYFVMLKETLHHCAPDLLNAS
ncbi:hypothetical protein ACJU26_01575 [Acidithiobacillus sp. M4-SHS-6]|uniref:hypothetical protein n=1 Tax=Acidithiobacillus sp. M4-SHS-6 TaxID=3383024 RepID=UPI0039BDA47D